MIDIVNLRTVRKQVKRQEAARLAEQNRARFGRTKAERVLERDRAEKARRDLEAHRTGREDGQ